MSTLSGFIEGIPGISVDRFLDRNREESKQFFLSHCHSDHMLGLNLSESLPGPLYTSTISAVFLKHRYPQLIGNIKTLDIGEPTNITTQPKLRVTTIPAGHCPGSVMFLFETDDNRNILYTGDFRLSPKDLRNLLALRKIELDVLYLDTTFFSKQYRYFPPQTQSLNKIVQLSREWLALHERNVISIKLPALYGSEFLFIELANQLEQKIHVRHEELQNYRFLAQLDEAVTSRTNETRIHACLRTSFNQYRKLPCRPELDSMHIRVIKPSALRWKNLSIGDPFWERLGEEGQQFSVCYSNHASFEELEDFVRYLLPKEVRFNVTPKNDSEGSEMRSLLGTILVNNETFASDVDFGKTDGNDAILKFERIVYQKSARKISSPLSDEEISDEEMVLGLLPKRIRS
ncbi:protein artemis-like [Toxorhynchites rutilus septentrionalis]|uniref:protein artemis-like n=1 Tax=Toxorhynchites rutilus septentrionalis TaxID=329112 RepID=UPI00247A65CA|nr:protein artemis-like [Toxorhynchites rutilus septentrionalis]